MLRLYEAEYKRRLLEGASHEVARAGVRSFMREFVYCGRPLGMPKFSKELWLQCGVLEGEESVPPAEAKNYCGLWFHFACTGLIREPMDSTQRVQCIHCLQDRRFKVRPPNNERVSHLAMWTKTGVPRILEVENGSRIHTLFLTCTCGDVEGSGLPCEGMLAVTREVGGVLSYHVYHRQLFSSKIVEFTKAEVTFEKNRRFQLDEDAVIGHTRHESRPATVGEDMRQPARVEVVDPLENEDVVGLADRVTMDGNAVEKGFDFGNVSLGPAKQARKKHRRYKSSSKQQGKK